MASEVLINQQEEHNEDFLTPPTEGPCSTAIGSDIFSTVELPELPDDLDQIDSEETFPTEPVSTNVGDVSSFIDPDYDEDEYPPQQPDENEDGDDEEEEKETKDDLEDVATPVVKTKTLTVRRPTAGKTLKLLKNHIKPASSEEKKTRKKRRNRPGTVALREIRRYQSSTDLLIPKAPISKLIREVAAGYHPTGCAFKFTKSAMEALHSEAEAFLQELFRDAQSHACAMRRIELMPVDLQTAFDNYVKAHNNFYK